MLLKLKLTILAFGLTVTPAAYSQNFASLDTGDYYLVEGDKELCRNFSIKEVDLSSKHFEFGGFYKFEISNSDYNVESDLDPQCSFLEQNRRTISANETLLTKVNEEICNQQVVSRTVSTASIKRDEIQVRHQLNGIDPYLCVWKKK